MSWPASGLCVSLEVHTMYKSGYYIYTHILDTLVWQVRWGQIHPFTRRFRVWCDSSKPNPNQSLSTTASKPSFIQYPNKTNTQASNYVCEPIVSTYVYTKYAHIGADQDDAVQKWNFAVSVTEAPDHRSLEL